MKLSETEFEAEHFKVEFIELAFPHMASLDQARRDLRNPASYGISNLRKGRVEVNKRRLTSDEKEQMRQAKGRKARQILKKEVVTRLEKGNAWSQARPRP